MLLPVERVVGRGLVDGYLSSEELARIASDGLAQLPVDGARVLVLIPDGTRTMPMPLMFETIERELEAGRRRSIISWRSARTRRWTTRSSARSSAGRCVEGRAGERRIFNHRWDDPATFVRLGTIPAQ